MTSELKDTSPKKPVGLQILKIISRGWHWILISTIATIFSGWAYIRYTPPRYTAEASLKFEDNKSEISELLNVKNRFYRQDKIGMEKFIICSRAVRKPTVNALQYHISYYQEKNFHFQELYPHQPLQIQMIRKAGQLFTDRIKFSTIDLHNFELSYTHNNINYKQKFRYTQPITLPGLTFKILRNELTHSSEKCFLSFNSDEQLMERLEKGLLIEENKNNGILHLKLSDTNPQFAKKALNVLVMEYLKYDQQQRSTSAMQTVHYIDTLLYNMKKSVSETGKAMEQFKISNNFMDISTATEYSSLKLSQLETEKYKLDVQRLYLSTVEKNVKNDTELNGLHIDMHGDMDPQLNELFKAYNHIRSLSSETNTTYHPASETVTRLVQELADLKAAISENITMQIQKTEKNSNYIIQRIAELKSQYRLLPTAERDFIYLKSAFDVNQKVFNYLSEKKLEAQISKAAATPSAFVIDYAVLPLKIVSPKPNKIYTLAVFSGVVLGIFALVIRRRFNPYIRTRDDLESLSDIPIVGTVTRSYTKPENNQLNVPVLNDPKSEFSESIRAIRSHLNFLSSDKRSKVICVSSDVSGEGKSFISVNIACAFSLLEKKVVLIATDLRKSNMHKLFHAKSSKGLSDFLAGDMESENIICTTAAKNLCFIPAGTVPPNPAELLLSSRMEGLLDELKNKFDLILMDTAPVGLVSDAIPLIKASDINLFILRSGISRIEAADVPVNLKNRYGLPNIYLILNSFPSDNPYHKYYSGGYYDR